LQGYMGIMNFVNHFILRKEIQSIKYLPLDIIIRENVDYYLNLTPKEAVMAPL
jgi:LacI family transcriptional regulator